MLVNDHAIARLDEERIDTIIDLVKQGTALDQWPQYLFAIEQNVQQQGIMLGCKPATGDALKAALKRSPTSFLEALERSGLRGRGGAGYPVYRKWQQCRDNTAAVKTVVCNADEGEPGTFKDRVLLARYAEDVIEGMTICAFVTGARQGFLYLRGEYRFLYKPLQESLQTLRSQGWLGRNIAGIAGFDFDIDIHLGAGAYVCGEESAMLESLEGKRGIPRIRPPFPVDSGYLNTPTVVNNVETFLAAARIALNGADWFRSCGTENSAGSRLLSISGDCASPGVYEVPGGITIREALAMCGAERTAAVQIAGAAGVTLAPGEFDRRIAFEDVATGGSFMVFDESRDLLDMVCNFTDFFVHESCGFCTPCRVGGKLMRDTVAGFRKGKGGRQDREELRVIAETLRETAFCGLGHTAPNPVLDTLEKFPSIYAGSGIDDGADALHVSQFDLHEALAEARSLIGEASDDS